jgi:hypothetical protein
MSIIPFSFLFYFHFLFFFLLLFPSHFFFFNFSSPFNSPRHPPPLPYRNVTLPCGLASNRTRRPTPRRAPITSDSPLPASVACGHHLPPPLASLAPSWSSTWLRARRHRAPRRPWRRLGRSSPPGHGDNQRRARRPASSAGFTHLVPADGLLPAGLPHPFAH